MISGAHVCYSMLFGAEGNSARPQTINDRAANAAVHPKADPTTHRDAKRNPVPAANGAADPAVCAQASQTTWI